MSERKTSTLHEGEPSVSGTDISPSELLAIPQQGEFRRETAQTVVHPSLMASRTLCVAATAFCPVEDPDCLHRMRIWLRDLFNRPAGPYAERFAVIELVVNELATNAIRHTRSGEGNFVVCAVWDRTVLRVTVCDQGSALTRPVAAGQWNYNEETGRGLALVGALCTWGYTATPHGTDAWALFHSDQTISDIHAPPIGDERTSGHDLRVHLVEGHR